MAVIDLSKATEGHLVVLTPILNKVTIWQLTNVACKRSPISCIRAGITRIL